MDQVPLTTPALLAQTWRRLAPHWMWALGLVAVSVALSLLAPALQLALKLHVDLADEALVRAAILLPMEMYFLPRLILALDAEGGSQQANPAETWRETFEKRWLKAFGTRVLVSTAVVLGVVFFILPGLIVLFFFGWAPMRVLLRGENLREACLGSARVMVRAWPRVVLAVLTLAGLYLLLSLGVAWVLEHAAPAPTPWIRLSHPVYWGTYTLSGALEVFFSVALLALYLDVEPLPK